MAIIPASIRNRNPGAMYPGKSAKKFGSSSFETLRSKDGVHKIATFPSAVQGAAALFDLLDQKYTGLTVQQAIERWCGGFYVSTYIGVLEEQANVKRSDLLTREVVRDPSKAIPLAKAMAWQEAGSEYPLSDAEWSQAHHCAFEQPTAPSFSPTNDVPSPKIETRVAEKAKAAGKIVAATVAGGSAVTVPAIDPVTTTAAISAWKSLGSAISEAATLATSSRMMITLTAGGLVYAVLVLLIPKLRRS